MRTGIVNARLIDGERIRPGGLYWEDGRILPAAAEALPCDETIDAQGAYLCPGFIDIHTHGGGGADFLDGTVEAFCTAARMHARHGTTTLIPTATSGSLPEMRAMTAAFEEALRENREGSDMPGLHLEGPYFSPAQAGAQDPRFLRNPEPEEYLPILDSTDRILRWSAAPELPGALAFGRELSRRGILAAIGHSDADYDQVRAAMDAGYRHVTHLYSCMSTVHRKNAYRRAGVVESAYLLNGLTVEIIADGCHLPGPLLEFTRRFIGPARTALVTDSMRGAGMPDGESVLGSRENGIPVILEEGVAKLPDRSAFAGSTATADRLVRVMTGPGGASLPEAVRMLTATPAAIMGLTDRGTLTPGLRADLVVLDDQLNVLRTVINGKTVWKKGN